jgi:hypothetical protein
MAKAKKVLRRKAPKPKLKQCFVIGPFGEENSDTRKWSDHLLKDVIAPLAKKFGYEAKRSLEHARTRDITSDLISKLILADLVVADLTFANANVYYELAVRHAIGLPFIHVIQNGQRLPFDIANLDVLPFPTRQDGDLVLPDAPRCIKKLEQYFVAVRDGTARPDSPLSEEYIGKSLRKALAEYKAARAATDKNPLNMNSPLPTQIKQSILKYAAQVPMYYKTFAYEIGLTHADGAVVYDMKVSFELVNVSDSPQTNTSRYPKLSRVAQLKKVTIDGDRVDLEDPALHGEDAITVKYGIAPGDSRRVEVWMSKTFSEQESDLFTAYSYPSANFKFRVVNRSPGSLKAWVEMLNNQNALVKRTGNVWTWTAEHPLLPNQGVRLLWRPVDEAKHPPDRRRTGKNPGHRSLGA